MATIDSGKPFAGVCFRALRGPAVVHLAAAARNDFVFWDLTEGAYSLSEVADCLLAARTAGVKSYVRVSDLNLVGRLLELGADGVAMSGLESPAQVQAFIAASKCPPLGKRRLSRQGGHSRYYPVDDLAAHADRANLESLSIVCIDSAEAAASTADLAALPGVDVLLADPLRLAASLGAPEALDGTKLARALEGVAEAARRQRIVFGMLASPAILSKWARFNLRFMVISSDAELLCEAFGQAARRCREGA